jgi:hypothetical protein
MSNKGNRCLHRSSFWSQQQAALYFAILWNVVMATSSLLAAGILNGARANEQSSHIHLRLEKNTVERFSCNVLGSETNEEFKKTYVNCVEFRATTAAVLNLWVATPLGVE